jgi:hypothetical protein
VPIPAEQDVRDILEQFHARLRKVIDRAWEEWMACDVRGRLIFARPKADIVFDFIARYALIEFGDDADIHVIAKNSTVKFLFKDTVLLRFKKGNSKGIGSNIETNAVLDFIDPQRKLFDLPNILKIEVCYQPDKLGTLIQDVAVVARDRNKKIWAYPLDGERGADVLPMRSPASPPDTGAPIVTVRKPVEKTDTNT